MDNGLTARPVAAPASYARPDSSLMRSAVATELGPAQSVTAASASTAPTAYAQPRPMPDPAQVSREVLIDPQTREVIYRTISVRTGRVIAQVPEEAMLKLRAYNRAELKKLQARHETVEKTA